MDATLHRTPRGRDVLLEQVRLVGLSLRPVALVFGIVLGVLTVLFAIDLGRGRAETWFDSGEWLPLSLIAGGVPFAVWRGEKRFGPAFLWTLPVDRRRLGLARVFAGWVWLMVALALFMTWQRVVAATTGIVEPRVIPFFAFVGLTGAYLFGSVIVVGLRHPLRWLLGSLGVCFFAGAFNQRVDELYASPPVQSAFADAARMWQALPPITLWALSILFWLGAGLAAMWIALSRHRERRRP